MALLRQHSREQTPFRTPAVGGQSGGVSPLRVFPPPGPLHWTPTPALSISISFLSQYVSRWRPMQDRCFNIGSALTYNNYRSVQPLFKSSPLSSLRPPRLFSAAVFCVFFRRPPRRCFGREFKTSSSHWWKWLSRWSEIDPLCSIQHRSDTATGQAGATPRGCAEIKTKRRGFGGKLSDSISLLRVLQLLAERVAVVSPTL